MSEDTIKVVLQVPVASEVHWMSFESPVEVLQTSSLAEVRDILHRAESAASDGKFAAGFVSYEAAPAFDPALQVQTPGA